MFSQLFAGAGFFLTGMRLITQPGIRRFALTPLLINIIIFSALIYFGYQQFGVLLDSFLPAEDGWFGWLRWVLVPFFFIFVLMITFFTFSIVANIIGAPFNGMLANAVERHLTGKTAENNSSFKQALANAVPMILSELKKLGYYILISIPFLVLLFIPVLGQLGWLLVSAWILTVQYVDFPLDNHDIKFSELRKRLGKKRMIAFGFGGSVMFTMAIPIINFFVMPIAVAGATALAVNHLSLEQKTTD